MTGRLYTYYPELDENDCLLWHVYEKATEQIIESFLFEDDAQHFVFKLENGFGFNGFTPSFILTKVPIPDINMAFTAEFA